MKILILSLISLIAVQQTAFAQEQNESHDALDGTLSGIGAVSAVTGYAKRARTFNRPDAWIGKGWFTTEQFEKIVNEAMRNIEKGSPEVLVTMKSDLGWSEETIRYVFRSTSRMSVEQEVENLLVPRGILHPTQFKFRKMGKGLPQVFMAAGAGFMGIGAADHWQLLTDRSEKELLSPPSRPGKPDNSAASSAGSLNN